MNTATDDGSFSFSRIRAKPDFYQTPTAKRKVQVLFNITDVLNLCFLRLEVWSMSLEVTLHESYLVMSFDVNGLFMFIISYNCTHCH